MNKQYRLPKPFAEKWINALEGGTYEQGKGKLFKTGLGYCCLGVACVIAGATNEEIEGASVVSDNGFADKKKAPEDFEWIENYPKELMGDADANTLVERCVRMNDGLTDEHFGGVQYTFKEIAAWIKENVELYDVPTPGDKLEEAEKEVAP